jgi:hypothetical protein
LHRAGLQAGDAILGIVADAAAQGIAVGEALEAAERGVAQAGGDIAAVLLHTGDAIIGVVVIVDNNPATRIDDAGEIAVHVIVVLGDVVDAEEVFDLPGQLPFCRIFVTAAASLIGNAAQPPLAVDAAIITVADVGIARIVDQGQAVFGVVLVLNADSFGVGLADEIAGFIVAVGGGAGILKTDISKSRPPKV